jgi:hypothetical protein
MHGSGRPRRRRRWSRHLRTAASVWSEVLTTHLLAEDVEAAESRLTEARIFERDLEWLTACDVLVAEASGSSYGVGFEVGYVLGRAASSGQQVVLLYDAGRRHTISRLITGNNDPACTAWGYTSTEHLTDFIDRRFAPSTVVRASARLARTGAELGRIASRAKP